MMMCCQPTPDTAASRRRGFTLVELIVTIGIIVFLAGLSMTGMTAMARRAEVQRTEDALRLLDMAMEEWELQAGRRLTWGSVDGAYDVWSQREHILILPEMLVTVRRNDAAASLLARIDPDLVYTLDLDNRPPWLLTQAEVDQAAAFDGHITVLDAWGLPVYATHPGAAYDGTAPYQDADGTERTINEYEYGIAKNRRICFVSAGPDGLFGLDREFPDLAGGAQHRAKREAARDNLYSYEPQPVPSYGGG